MTYSTHICDFYAASKTILHLISVINVFAVLNFVYSSL